MMRSTLYKTNMLSWIFIVLVYWNNSPRIDMSFHSDTLFWFRATQSLFFLLNAVCLAEKQEIPISIVFGLTRSRLEPMFYCSWCEHTITPLMQWMYVSLVSGFILVNYIWLGVSCVTSREQFFSYVTVTSYIKRNDADVHFIQDQHA
jgi:hypothetical protein